VIWACADGDTVHWISEAAALFTPAMRGAPFSTVLADKLSVVVFPAVFDADPVLAFLLHENNVTDKRQVDKINERFI
jgi:hypothetical protein